MYNKPRRPRRNRKSAAMRAMVEETTLSINDFIYPIFLIEGSGQKEEISSMPGIYRYSLDLLLKEIHECVEIGIKGFCIFPSLKEEKKDKYATEGYNKNSLYIQALMKIKSQFPQIKTLDPFREPIGS